MSWKRSRFDKEHRRSQARSRLGPNFLKSPRALTIGRAAERFGTLPSEMLKISDPVVAVALDEAIALRLTLDEKQQQERTSRPGELPPGQEYESWQDAIDTGRVH